MTVFQMLSLAVFAALVVLTLSAGVRGQVRKRIVSFWLLVWIAGATTIAWPRSTALLARALGIGRGADLVLYVSAVTMLVGFFYIYTRFRRMDRQMTLLVRRLAIEHPQHPDAPAPASDPAGSPHAGAP